MANHLVERAPLRILSVQRCMGANLPMVTINRLAGGAEMAMIAKAGLSFKDSFERVESEGE